MIKTIIRALYSAFISIVLISIILAGWTCFAFISQPTKSGEIINLIQDMYEGQKSVIINVLDLSKLLIKDNSERIASEDNNLLTESELLIDQEDKSLLDEPSILEDNGDNPLGIIIEPSLPEVIEENLPESSEGPLDNDQSEVSMNEMEMEMDMNLLS
ncbi:hypothetical protein [Prochlorococcus marinus]|uniref:hypothetical protein n=1 Tax=Prochlorococcus marinus TaxID=1219 RepID=UPI0022B3E620|nr:hypothetical protein [Prochlorococcus marinus]